MPHKITYSAVGYNADGGYVNVEIWGDSMNIQADGFGTAQDAIDHAPVLFGQDSRVAAVGVRESIQEFDGGGWRPGRHVAQVEREKPDENVR